MDKDGGLIRKTMVIHPLMDGYVRKTWSILIENGHDATYSEALNFMLLAAIQEAIKDEGLSPKTRDNLWRFVNDRKTVSKLNLQDHVATLRAGYGK